MLSTPVLRNLMGEQIQYRFENEKIIEDRAINFVMSGHRNIICIIIPGRESMDIPKRHNSFAPMTGFRTLDLTMTNRALLFLFLQLFVLFLEVVPGDMLANAFSGMLKLE